MHNKEDIVGVQHMTPPEKALAADKKVVLYMREKHENVVQDIAHHLALTSAVLVSPGRGPTVWGMHKNDVTLLVLVTNKSHQELLTEFIMERMIEESKKETCVYYLPRSKIIDDQGLAHDELQPIAETATPTKDDENANEGGNNLEDEGGEEGEEEEPLEEEEEEESGSGDPEIDSQDTVGKPVVLKRPAASTKPKPPKKLKK
jgi:hypothetical protein